MFNRTNADIFQVELYMHITIDGLHTVAIATINMLHTVATVYTKGLQHNIQALCSITRL